LWLLFAVYALIIAERAFGVNQKKTRQHDGLFTSKKVLLFGRFFQCSNFSGICAVGTMDQPCFGIGDSAASGRADCGGNGHGFLSRINNGIENHLIDFFGHLILLGRIFCFEFISFHKII